MNRYWFLKLLNHLSIWYDFSKFPCLVVKTVFKFYSLLSPPLANFPFWKWRPASIYLQGGKPVYAESLCSKDKNNFWRIFLSMLGSPQIFIFFCATQFMQSA